jgi:hypothetical protein
VAPTEDSSAEQMYLQCQVNVPGQAQPILAYAPVTIRTGDESRKKKKKRRSWMNANGNSVKSSCNLVNTIKNNIGLFGIYFLKDIRFSFLSQAQLNDKNKSLSPSLVFAFVDRRHPSLVFVFVFCFCSCSCSTRPTCSSRIVNARIWRLSCAPQLTEFFLVFTRRLFSIVM